MIEPAIRMICANTLAQSIGRFWADATLSEVPAEIGVTGGSFVFYLTFVKDPGGGKAEDQQRQYSDVHE